MTLTSSGRQRVPGGISIQVSRTSRIFTGRPYMGRGEVSMDGEVLNNPKLETHIARAVAGATNEEWRNMDQDKRKSYRTVARRVVRVLANIERAKTRQEQ
jgi:hypothetical protein